MTVPALDDLPMGELAARLGLELLEASPDKVVATMPVEGNRQPYGLLHGGASVALAETVGSIAAALHAGPGRIAVGIEISASHHRGIEHGTVTGTAVPRHRGRTLASYDIDIRDSDGRLICSSRLTCIIRDAPPG